MKNYYETLGVDKTATKEDIKKSYKKMSMKHHPDKNQGSKESEEKFKEISEAYSVLSDDQKRQEYDTYGTGGNPFGGNPFGNRQQSHGFNMDDIFNEFFGGRSNQRQKVRRGNDLRVQVSITLEDVILGTNKKVKYKRQKPCSPCSGKGGTELKKCLACNGFGHRNVTQHTHFGVITQTVACNVCNSSGQIVSNPCKSCNGEGTTLVDEVVDIDLPKGLSNGIVLTMSGHGNHVRDGQPGDLQISIVEIPHNKFKRDGNDIYCDEWISIPDAVLGTNIKIQTIQGEVDIKVDEGCESGKIFNIRGKGTPVLSNNGQPYGSGNLYVKVNVKIPTGISSVEKEIFQKLKSIF